MTVVRIPADVLHQGLCWGQGGKGAQLKPPRDFQVSGLGTVGAAVVFGEAVLGPWHHPGSGTDQLTVFQASFYGDTGSRYMTHITPS